MNISAIIQHLESIAPPVLQESYDNAGLITGNGQWECSGVLCTLDSTEAVIEEAKSRGCNLVVAHHPIIFGGLKKITGRNYVERTVIAAIKNDVAIYAIHTNLDNIIGGVNGRIADRLNLVNRSILLPKDGMLRKLFTFVPLAHADKVRQAIFEAGAGHIGNYSECSFSSEGVGTFKAGENTNPYVGDIGSQHKENELRVEVIFPSYLEPKIVKSLLAAHPYEEPAYDIISLQNNFTAVGSGLIGELETELPEAAFLAKLKQAFGLKLVRHTELLGKPVKKVAVCGGAGSFLISKALSAGADVYITADLKYHELFDAENRLVVCDIGHYESEQFTIELLADILQQKFPTFAVLKSDTKTNPVYYYF